MMNGFLRNQTELKVLPSVYRALDPSEPWLWAKELVESLEKLSELLALLLVEALQIQIDLYYTRIDHNALKKRVLVEHCT